MCRSAWPRRPSTRSSPGSGGQLLHVRHERLHLGRRGHPFAVEQLGHGVRRVVEGEIRRVVSLDAPGLDRGPRIEPDRPRIDEDGRDEGLRGFVLGLGRKRPGDRLRVDTDVETVCEEQARRRVVIEDEDAVDVLGPELQSQARLAGVDQDGKAPVAARLLHHQHAEAALHADDEPGLELAQDHQAARIPPDGRGNGRCGRRHELPQDRLARLDADDEIGPRRAGIAGARLGGAENRDQGQNEQFLHGGGSNMSKVAGIANPEKWFNQGGVDLESADWTWFRARRPFLVEAARGDLVLVPAEEMPEFVEVRQADLVAERPDVLFRKIPQIGRVEVYPGRLEVPARELGPVRAAGEQAQEVGLKAVGQNVRGGSGLKAHRHGPRGLADVGREPALGRGHRVGGDLDEPGLLHLSSAERSNFSNLQPSHHNPTAASPARIASTTAEAAAMDPLTLKRWNEKMMSPAAHAAGAATTSAIRICATPKISRWPNISIPAPRVRDVWYHPGMSTMIEFGTINWMKQMNGATDAMHRAVVTRTAGVSQPIPPWESMTTAETRIESQRESVRTAVGARSSPKASLQPSSG